MNAHSERRVLLILSEEVDWMEEVEKVEEVRQLSDTNRLFCKPDSFLSKPIDAIVSDA